MTESKNDDTRSIVIEHEVPVTPDEVFRVLTDSSEVARWFPLEAKIEPQLGGEVWLSWGPGCEGAAPIHIYDAPSRVGWTENYGDDENGKPIEVAVDFYVESKDGVTVVRLVQSGLSANADWDEMYDALVDGWTYFMFNLVFYLAKHRGKPRGMVWRRVATDLARDAVWERLMGGVLLSTVAGMTPGAPFELRLDQTMQGEVVSARHGHHFTGTLPSLGDSLLFIEVEGPHVGIWLSTYGKPDEEVAALQAELDAQIEATLGAE
jgi:uncharacterized protein YndB with AHSA1/START domain